MSQIKYSPEIKEKLNNIKNKFQNKFKTDNSHLMKRTRTMKVLNKLSDNKNIQYDKELLIELKKIAQENIFLFEENQRLQAQLQKEKNQQYSRDLNKQTPPKPTFR